MKHHTLPIHNIDKVICIIIVASLLVAILSSCGTPATQTVTLVPPRAQVTSLTTPIVQLTPVPEVWRQTMLQVPLPKNGCFQVTYPGLAWQEVPCTTAPTYPQLPESHSPDNSVGNGNSYAAQVPGNISSATGSFDAITGLTSETGNKFSTDCSSSVPDVRNTFTLQLNTNVFSTTVSGCNQLSGCKGWQQFIYSNSGKVYIQNWLIDYGTPCPKDYTSFGDDCFSGSSAMSVAAQAIENLAQLSLTANVTPSENTVILSIRSSNTLASDQLSAVRQDNLLNLAHDWNSVEFNIFGDGCAAQASFNPGTELTVRLNVASHPMSVPTCINTGFTEETNNLFLRSCSSVGGEGMSPGIMFMEDNKTTSSGIYWIK